MCLDLDPVAACFSAAIFACRRCRGNENILIKTQTKRLLLAMLSAAFHTNNNDKSNLATSWLWIWLLRELCAAIAAAAAAACNKYGKCCM